jgi:hypothetical protein
MLVFPCAIRTALHSREREVRKEEKNERGRKIDRGRGKQGQERKAQKKRNKKRQ